MAESNAKPGAATEREFMLTRVFDAPRELVWKAWTDPKHMARWWGPHTFPNPVREQGRSQSLEPLAEALAMTSTAQ